MFYYTATLSIDANDFAYETVFFIGKSIIIIIITIIIIIKILILFQRS